MCSVSGMSATSVSALSPLDSELFRGSPGAPLCKLPELLWKALWLEPVGPADAMREFLRVVFFGDLVGDLN